MTVGGTSAGLAILGQFIYSSLYDTIYSPEALANPYDGNITFAYNFLTIPFLTDFLTDTHFVTRDRMGRMLTFQARLVKENRTLVKGVGVDEATALLLDTTTGIYIYMYQTCKHHYFKPAHPTVT